VILCIFYFRLLFLCVYSLLRLRKVYIVYIVYIGWYYVATDHRWSLLDTTPLQVFFYLNVHKTVLKLIIVSHVDLHITLNAMLSECLCFLLRLVRWLICMHYIRVQLQRISLHCIGVAGQSNLWTHTLYDVFIKIGTH
jgi:hypothetical protein